MARESRRRRRLRRPHPPPGGTHPRTGGTPNGASLERLGGRPAAASPVSPGLQRVGQAPGRAKIALECVECRKEAGEIAPGGQAFLVGDPDIEDDEEIVVYCPDCARREFGPFNSEAG